MFKVLNINELLTYIHNYIYTLQVVFIDNNLITGIIKTCNCLYG